MGHLRADNVNVDFSNSAMHDAVEEAVEDHLENKEEDKTMNNIAGLLALMQNNKNMDIPGLLALCKEKGYNQGWGGEGMFMFVFLILFLFAGGGWGNLANRSQEQFAAAAGQNLQDIIGIYDRFAQVQQNTSNSFAQLDTKICSSIAETIAAVRNQGDRNYDATRNVGDAVRDCCCTMRAMIAELGCKVDGLYGHTSVLQERTVNAIEKGNCALENRLTLLEGKMELGFERTQCLITNTAQQQEKDRLARQVEELKAQIQGNNIAKETLAAMQAWTSQNYAFTRTATSPVVNSASNS